MASTQVIIKHQGKKYDVEVDLSSNGETFKYQLYSLTGVEPERQKILVKGGQLKDDAAMSSLGLKTGQTLMMMGTPSADGNATIERPKEKIIFLEDMSEAEAARSDGAIPAGLQNLGNTCYMNATVQTLRSIPELQDELSRYNPGSNTAELSMVDLGDLTLALRHLFTQMADTQEAIPPIVFLSSLRQVFPQFAQRARDHRGYAQQDAEEAWSQIVSVLRQKQNSDHSAPASSSNPENSATSTFIDRYMSGQFHTVVECDEEAAREAGESKVEGREPFLKLNCHVNGEISYLRDGLLAAKETFKKASPTLGRDAVYTKTSTISRLPKYLAVHLLRFDWRRTTNKKAKILRKVTFPLELDVVELCTAELQKSLIPVRDKIYEVKKDEEDIQRTKKRQKRKAEDHGPSAEKDGAKTPTSETKATAGSSGSKADKEASKVNGKKDVDMPDVEYKTDAQIEAEMQQSLTRKKKEVTSLVDPKLAADEGTNVTGLYELRGVITHQGTSADSGHYTSFIKKVGRKDPATGKSAEEDGNWWWFNDEKVSQVDSEKIKTLCGGGQNHSALILLYRAISLPEVEEGAEAVITESTQDS